MPAPGITPVPTQELPELYLMIPAVAMSTFPCAVYESATGVASLADSSTINSLTAAYGVAIGNTAAGTVQVVRRGYIKNAGWSWTPYQLIYVGTSGALTQTAPSSNPTVLGFAISATEMEVRVSPPASSSGGGGSGGGGLQILASGTRRSTSVSTSSTTPVAVDATNLSVTFTVPANGQALVRLQGVCQAGNTGSHHWWVLLNTSGSSVSGVYEACYGNPASTARITTDILMTGLTPGASVTYRWGFYTDSGTITLYSGTTDGSLDIVVYAVNTTTPPSVAKTLIAPATGFSNTIPSSSTAPIIAYVLNPAGTLATGTITMPATPVDSQIVSISSGQTITSLTLNANTGQSIKNAATTLNSGPAGTIRYIYDAASTTWYPA